MSAIDWLGAAVCAALISGCTQAPERAESAESRRAAAAADTGFEGVDQYTSTHVFEPLPDGGRIQLQRDVSDSAGRERIVAHMGRIAAAFSAGDFRLPGFVHAREVPGTLVMTAERGKSGYAVESLPRGAALQLRTTDSVAVEAIHAGSQRHDEAAEGDQQGAGNRPPRAGAIALPVHPGLAMGQVAKAVGEVGATGFPETVEGVQHEGDGGGPGGLQEWRHRSIRSSGVDPGARILGGSSANRHMGAPSRA